MDEITKMLMAILPEICLLGLAVIVLALDVIWHGGRKNALGWITVVGLAAILAVSVLGVRPPAEPELIWGGMLQVDAAGFLFRLIFILGAALTALFTLDHPLAARGEFYGLLLVSTLGMTLMASSADLLMLFLAIETASIPLYILAGFMKSDQASGEAGIKYLLFGGTTSAVMLFGFSLIYGFSGTTRINEIGGLLGTAGWSPLPWVLALVMVLAGFAFKISAAPFHFWAPDVYEGAPTPVAGFLSTASKAAGFVVLLRVMLGAFSELAGVWMIAAMVLATLSMVIGNLLALAQKNIKRLLAYSSISHAGYILIGVAANSELGTAGAMYYLLAYLFTNLAAFGIVGVAGRLLGSDEIAAYAGLSRRSAGLGVALLVALLSLGGIPPFGGFFGKLLVFAAGVQAKQVWLVFLGVLNTVVGLYYYLNVLKVVYMGESAEGEKPLPLAPGWTLALVLCVAGILVLGVILAPWYDLATRAAGGLAAAW